MSTTIKALIAGYFEHIIDGRSDDVAAFFVDDCVIHRADLSEPILGRDAFLRFLQIARFTVASTKSTILSICEEGDGAIAHIAHRVTFASVLMTPLGMRDVRGRQVEWQAFARFVARSGKLAEEWVIRDEMGIYRQLGLLNELNKLRTAPEPMQAERGN